MDEVMMPRAVHDADMARMERANKRLWVLVVLLVVLFVASNGAWIYYESQFAEEITTEVEQNVDTADGNAYVAGVGDVSYGTSSAESDSN